MVLCQNVGFRGGRGFFGVGSGPNNSPITKRGGWGPIYRNLGGNKPPTKKSRKPKAGDAGVLLVMLRMRKAAKM